MMINVEKAANAMGGMTARACDGCLRRRARWFCAPDDAFLCQACDSSVHSANQLASRHERIRLQTTSSSSKPMNSSLTRTGDIISPGTAWHRRRARTPRRNSNSKNSWMSGRQHDVEKANRWGNLMEPIVPEMGSEQGSMDEDEFDEQMTCRVPVFDPFEAEFFNNDDQVNQVNCDMKVVDGDDELEGFNEFLPSDLDLAEFAADVESFLGAETEEDSKGIDITSNNNVYHELHNKIDDQKAVMEELPGVRLKTEADFVVSSAMADLEYDDPVITGNGKEAEEKKVFPVGTTSTVDDGAETSQVEMKRKRLLKLNYECVIAAWASKGSPWTTGTRPEFKPGACWPDFAACDGGSDYKGGRGRRIDGEREARVSRYREKRRTRLFSKKIRYEVRKLNAEKRPRMKGRFVKRSLFMPMGDFSCFSVY